MVLISIHVLCSCHDLIESIFSYRIMLIWFIKFGSYNYKQIIGIPMRTYRVPLFVDLFLHCYEKDLCYLFLSISKFTLTQPVTEPRGILAIF